MMADIVGVLEPYRVDDGDSRWRGDIEGVAAILIMDERPFGRILSKGRENIKGKGFVAVITRE